MLLEAHWRAIAGVDFFTTEVWTRRGLVTVSTAFVIDLASRQVQILGSTPHPEVLFMQQIVRTPTMAEESAMHAPHMSICDRECQNAEESDSPRTSTGTSLTRPGEDGALFPYTGLVPMRGTSLLRLSISLSLLSGAVVLIGQQVGDPVSDRHPAIEYSTRPTSDPVSNMNRRIVSGDLKLKFEPTNGYLKAVLEALQVAVESQMLVYSETSVQFEHITQTTPRALYFNDSMAVGWVKGADSLEVSAQDSQQGVVFYTLTQTPTAAATFPALAALPRVSRGGRHARRTGHAQYEHAADVRRSQRIRDRLGCRSPDADCRSLGRLVRHGCRRTEPASRQRAGVSQ